MKLLRLLVTICMILSMVQLQAISDPSDTRQIIIDIDTDFTACCTTLQNDLSAVFTIVPAIENLISNLGCSPTLITQAMVGSTGFVITQSGVYQLASSIVFSPVGAASAITINADNVLLDLACFTISQGNGTTGVNAISIGAHNDIMIRNGSLGGVTQNGISIAAGSSNISLLDTQIKLCNSHGIFFNGTTVNPINTVMLLNLELLTNGTGVTLQSTNQGTISGCFILESTNAGIELINSFSNKVTECTVADTESITSAAGISAITGGNNYFLNCIIDNTSTSATSSTQSAAGIILGATENNDIIMNNQISNVFTTPNASPFGINMQYTFSVLTNSGLPEIDDGTGATAIVNTLDWTPSNGRFLATGSGTNVGGLISVFEYTGKALVFITSVSQGTGAVTWSPDGSFLSTSNLFTAAGAVQLFSFDGLSLTSAISPTLAIGSLVNSLDWAANGRFIIIGSVGAPQVRIAEFNRGQATLAVITSASVTVGTSVVSVNWAPNGNFYAIATSSQVQVYNFSAGLTSTLMATFANGVTVSSVSWSPDGRYVAMGGATGAGGEVRVLNFTGSSLVLVASFTHGANVSSVNWSPDGNYVVMGGASSGGVDTRVLQFTGNSLIPIAAFSNGATVNAIQWSPLGNVIALCSAPIGPNNTVGRILSGLQFPSGTIIRNNYVTLTNGPALAAGVPGVSTGRGLVASSGSNLILQNTAFSNDINYIFADNVFSKYVQSTRSSSPTLIANLSFPPL